MGSRLYRSIFVLTLSIVTSCSGIQTDTTPVDRFAAANYRSFSWRVAPFAQRLGGDDSLAALEPTLRSSISKALADKGYSELKEGGDFLISLQIEVRLSEGALSSSASKANNEFPAPNPNVVVNRRTDQALVDNAYALAGPREVSSILLAFSDGESQNLVWEGSISKVIENMNRQNSDPTRKAIGAAVSRVLRVIPNATP